MTVFLRSESWKWLSRMLGASDSDFLKEVKIFLEKDFDQAFELLRTQKLLSRSRSLEITKSLCTELEEWVRTARLSQKERSRLVRHCRVTVGLQSMMSSVRTRTESLKIWELCFSDFAALLIGTLEATNVAFGRRLVAKVASFGGDKFVDLNSTNNAIFRATLDSAQLILNEGRKECSDPPSDFTTGNPAAFVESLQLAQETAEIMLVWDCYSFDRAQVTVTRKEIKVNRRNAAANIRLGNYRQRMIELDLADRSSTNHRFNMLSEKLKDDVPTEALSVPFDEFVALPAGERVLEQLLPLTKELEKDISDDLDILIDLDAEVKLGRLKHVYRDLITLWCYIVRIAVASRILGELVHSTTDEYPRTVITAERLKQTFVGLRQLPESSIDKGISHFSSFADQKHHLDLFHQPLLRISEHEILIPASYILNSRFDRNLISLVAREKNDSLAVKGKKPLRRLRILFEQAGYRCLEEIGIRDSTGNLATDLDLVAYKGNDIFFFQSKVLSIPDTPYEHWRVDQTLLSAAIQMDVVLNHKSQVESACRKDNLTFNLEGKTISAYLITDVMVHSGFLVGGYEVIDFDYLQHTLQGAHFRVLDVLSQKTIAAFKTIEGRFPSAEEIRHSISDLRSPKSRPVKASSQQRIELGGWALIFDVREFG